MRISDFSLHFYAYERASYGHIKSITRHDGRDAIIAWNCQSAVCWDYQIDRNINALNLEIRKKDTELINLRERLAKYENPDKNTNNSSTPPSKERINDEVIRRTRSLRKQSGKKPGGQKGHDGHKLSCSSIPDEVIDEVPNNCIRCRESLSDAERVLDYVTQIISIPELKPVITEILSELNTEQEWSGKVTNLFREAIHERNVNPNDV